MKLNICTFNIRYDNPDDGVNWFDNRAPFIQKEFPKYKADIIGFQEATTKIRDWLETTFPEYEIVGTGRSADRTGEHTAIAYRKDLFLLHSLDTFWLSNTPYVPETFFGTDQGCCPRICTVAILMDRQSKKLLRFYNTHLDCSGPIARAQGLTLILSRIVEDEDKYPGTPIVVTGDFNAVPESEVIADINKFSYRDIKLTDVTSNIDFTYHDYKPEKTQNNIKIDYIYTNASCDPTLSHTLEDHKDGVYFSDHYPVMATIEI